MQKRNKGKEEKKKELQAIAEKEHCPVNNETIAVN